MCCAIIEKSMVHYFRTSTADHPPLRIGLLLDTAKVSAFVDRIIEDITASNFVNLELLVFRKAPLSPAQPDGSRSTIGKLARRFLNPTLRRHTLYDLYLRLDRGMKPAGHPLDPVDCSELLAGIESIEVEPIGKKFVHQFPPDALEYIRSKRLDVLIRFGFNILRGEILNTARYGVWSYHHGDNEFYRGGPSHFWELYEGSPLSGVILQVLTEELDGGLVLCKSLFATQQTLSLSKNRIAPYWGSTDLMIRKLNELHQHGWDYVRHRAVPPVPYRGKRKIYRVPTNWDMVRWLGPVILKKVVRYPFRGRTVQHWRIAVRQNGKPLFDAGPEVDRAGFRWLDPPKGHFWADPFAVEHEGRNWVFFEDFSYQESRGCISCAELTADGALGSPVRCLEGVNHHLSYPHVFRSGGDLFMIPESFDSESVDLYRCQEFPSQWTWVATLLRGRFVDTTVWQHDGLWWLMTTSAEHDARSDSLLLFYSDALNDRWHFHPGNPISTDIRNNRGAGRVFEAGNRLIRPSQNCCPIYGHSFTMNKITELSPTRYAEHAFKTVTPWDGLSGLHTYNWVRNVEVIDGQTPRALSEVLISTMPTPYAVSTSVTEAQEGN